MEHILLWLLQLYFLLKISHLQCDANGFARLTSGNQWGKKPPNINDLTLAGSFCALQALVESQI